MKVLFLYPNVARARSPQVGLSSLAGTLEREGHESRLVDITFLEDAEVAGVYRHELEAFQPDLIGISCRSTEWETAVAMLGMVKTEVPVVVGGPHATIAPDEVIMEDHVDMLVRGEGEGAIIDILGRLASGGDLRDVPNLWIKIDGEVFKNDVRPLVQDMDSLAMPHWDIWDDRHFRQHYHQVFYPSANVFGDLETSRGCPYSCPYCITPAMQELYRGKGKFHREKSAGRIIAEVNKLNDERGIDYVRFVDETFILNRRRLKEFAVMYSDIRLPFSFSTRPETVSDEMMRLLSEVGANCVSFGLESGNEEYRREMLNRKTRQQQVIDAVAIAKRYGVKTFAFVMIGLPHEDREKIQDTLELINILQPDVFQISIFYPFEGTPFFDYCLKEGFLREDHDRLTEVWKGSILNQPGLSSDYLVRLRELALGFAKHDRRLWPLMYYLEKRPHAFKVWRAGLQAKQFSGKVYRRLWRTYGDRRKSGHPDSVRAG